MIDLHMHTTASDGRLSPAELVAQASAAGLSIIAVTDHDTVAAIADVTALASTLTIRVIPGIEITAVDDGRDVHMLGYFIDAESEPLADLLRRQRAIRVQRVRDIGSKLATLGMPVDVESVLIDAAARPGSSVGRPQLARELVRAGHVTSVADAFELWLANGRPAFLPREGPSPSAVVAAIHDAGGVASMAHPGVTHRDELIAPLFDRGLDAIEVYHSDHSDDDTQTYRRIAHRYGALITGGSDFHGDGTRRARLGTITLPPADFARLEERSHAYPPGGGHHRVRETS